MRNRARWAWVVVAVAAVGLIAAQTVAPASTSAPAPAQPKKDWQTVVDFTNTGLDRFHPADAALLKQLEPSRIKDPAERAKFQKQLDGLIQVQSAALARGASPNEIAKLKSPYPVSPHTIDPGCQLDSSNPGGYDLCGYNSNGDTMSLWASGRKHKMWAGVQEMEQYGGITCDCWRVWWKSQAYGLSSNSVSHYVDVDQLEAWDGGDYDSPAGTIDPEGKTCDPCYGVGATPREQWYTLPGSRTGGTFFVRDFVHINGTLDDSETNNNAASYWWRRGSADSVCNGPRNYGIGC